MKKMDILSRLEQYRAGADDNKDVVLLEPTLFAWASTVIDVPGNLLDRIRHKYGNLDAIARTGLTTSSDWKEENHVITFQERIYVPKDTSLRGDIIKSHHDMPTAGHPGHYKTLELVTRNYYWPGLTKDVRRYVEGCSLLSATN